MLLNKKSIYRISRFIKVKIGRINSLLITSIYTYRVHTKYGLRQEPRQRSFFFDQKDLYFRREGDSNPWYDYSYASLAMKYFRHSVISPVPVYQYVHIQTRSLYNLIFPRPVGLEPTTSGFGDLRSTN